MAISEKSNQGLMKAIKRMHTLVESDDLERVRASQENISALLKHRELNYEPFQVGEIPSEWVSVKRSHMRKFVIFYCHGGGYNTGSFHYARSITNKLSSTTSMDVLSFDYRLAPEHPYPYLLCKQLEFKNILARFSVEAPVNEAEKHFKKTVDLTEAETVFAEAERAETNFAKGTDSFFTVDRPDRQRQVL